MKFAYKHMPQGPQNNRILRLTHKILFEIFSIIFLKLVFLSTLQLCKKTAGLAWFGKTVLSMRSDGGKST